MRFSPFRLLFPILLAAVIGFFGCSSKDDDSPVAPTTDAAKARERVAQANQIFIPKLALILNSGSSDSASMDFSAATALYREALTYDPSNNQARFGIGLTEMLSMGADPQMRAMFEGMDIGSFSSALENPIFFLPKSPSVTAMMPALAGPAKGLPGPNPLGFYRRMQTQAEQHPFSYYQNIIETRLLPVLSDAISQLTTVAADQNFAFYVTPQQVGGNIQDSIRIDVTVIYGVLAVLQVVHAEASFMTAYNVDYDNTSAAAVVAAWQPGSSFLKLRPNGAAAMGTTLADIRSAMTSVQNAIAALRRQTDQPGTELIRYNPSDDTELLRVVGTADSVKSVLAGPRTETIEIHTPTGTAMENLTFNISSFFTSPIVDFKAKVPPYTVSAMSNSSGRYDAVLTWTAQSFETWIFPDPAFSGLLPGMTDSRFKQIAEMKASGWERSVRIEF